MNGVGVNLCYNFSMLKEVVEDRLFIIGMWWRIVYGLFRVVLGFFILGSVGSSLWDIFKKIMSHELVDDPKDVLYHMAEKVLGHHPIYITYFLAFYFIFWGLMDIFLSYNLLKHRLWTFPLSIVVIATFVLYEIFRFTHTHSLILLWIIFFDIFILWLIKEEYRQLKNQNLDKESDF